MKVVLFPIGAKSVNEVVHLDFAIKLINRTARQQPTYKFKKDVIGTGIGACRNCGIQSFLELHHVKPVWAFALDIVLREKPNSYDEVYRIIESAMNKQIDFYGLNSHHNLIGLCHQCHTKADSAAYSYWKEYFEKRYRVLFGVRCDYRRYLNENPHPARQA